ncbi:hypothetical protein Tco_0262327 [Tanacetum coccineum]
MDTKLLSAPELNNTLARCLPRLLLLVWSFGNDLHYFPFLPGMTSNVTGSKLFHVSAFLTQGTVSSIPIVSSWGDSIRPEGFLSSVLLWLVIIVAVVGVGVTVVVVVESSSVVKLSFVIT